MTYPPPPPSFPSDSTPPPCPSRCSRPPTSASTARWSRPVRCECGGARGDGAGHGRAGRLPVCLDTPARHPRAAPPSILHSPQAYTRNSEYLSAQLERQRAFHAANLETYRAAREAYLKKVCVCGGGGRLAGWGGGLVLLAGAARVLAARMGRPKGGPGRRAAHRLHSTPLTLAAPPTHHPHRWRTRWST